MAGGIWSERPRDRRGERRGVLGTAWSSLLLRSSFSWKVGEGARTEGVVVRLAVGGSEKERDFEGVLVSWNVKGAGAAQVKCDQPRYSGYMNEPGPTNVKLHRMKRSFLEGGQECAMTDRELTTLLWAPAGKAVRVL